MQLIETVSLTNNVNAWLAEAHHPRILHVFDNACNLINERGEVLSVVTPQIGNGPFNLVVEGDSCFIEQLSPESLVTVSRGQLILGDLAVNTAGAKLWNPHPEWEVLHAKREVIAHQVQGIAASQTALLAMTELHSPISNSLVSSLFNENLISSIKAARQLAGLGIGLTPAGDDFIMGAVLALWIIHPTDVASVFAKEVADTAALLTTSLSAAWLRSAGRGEAGQMWHDLFDALISADKMVIQESVDNILAVGHTSGADALTGFLGVFNSYAESI
jgi:hypothetical protein